MTEVEQNITLSYLPWIIVERQLFYLLSRVISDK